jgi:hypothetical protein
MKAARQSKFRLQFPAIQIRELALRYTSEMNDRDRALTKIITDEVFPAYRERGFLTKEQFATVCEWKSPRAMRCLGFFGQSILLI